VNETGERAPLLRCVAVWLVVSTAVGPLLAWLGPDLAGAASATRHLDQLAFDRALMLLAAVAVAGCAVWFWLVTTAVAIEAAHGATYTTAGLGCPASLRRLIFAACGLALATGLAAPAGATEAHSQPHTPHVASAQVLEGLPLPDRPSMHDAPRVEESPPAPHVGPRHPGLPREDFSDEVSDRHEAARPAPGETVRVREGDSLWSLAAATLPSDAGNTQIAERWHQIYELNHGVIGADPDLIVPGTSLDLPDFQEDLR